MASVEELNQAETDWIAGLYRVLDEAGVAGDADQLSTFLVQQRDAWLATPVDARQDPNPMINAIGAALGELLNRELGLSWGLATDEFGTEAAVHGQPGDVLLYPMNAVAKRWTGEADGSLADYVARARESVDAARGVAQD